MFVCKILIRIIYPLFNVFDNIRRSLKNLLWELTIAYDSKVHHEKTNKERLDYVEHGCETQAAILNSKMTGFASPTFIENKMLRLSLLSVFNLFQLRSYLSSIRDLGMDIPAAIPISILPDLKYNILMK